MIFRYHKGNNGLTPISPYQGRIAAQDTEHEKPIYPSGRETQPCDWTGRNEIEIIGKLEEMKFDKEGNLIWEIPSIILHTPIRAP